MADPEVVVRLLAAIDEREREYNRCAEELHEAARAKVRLPHTEFLRATVGDGLRLCQAHRDIVAKFERTKRLLDEANQRALQHVMDGTVATRQEQRDFDSLHIEEAVLGEVVEDLSGGYGIEDTQ